MPQTQTVNRTYLLKAPVRDRAALDAAVRAILLMTERRANEITPGYLRQFPDAKVQPRYYFDDKSGTFTGAKISAAPKAFSEFLEAAYLTLDEDAERQRAAINQVVPVFFQYDSSLESALEAQP